MCLQCGIQIFFRGQEGIKKLYRLIRSENVEPAHLEDDNDSFAVFNRLQHLKQQKAWLEEKQTGFSFDRDRQRVIEIVDVEIARLRSKLEEERRQLTGQCTYTSVVGSAVLKQKVGPIGVRVRRS
jgi:hypothetical protein